MKDYMAVAHHLNKPRKKVPGTLVWLKAHSLIMFSTWPLKGIKFLAVLFRV